MSATADGAEDDEATLRRLRWRCRRGMRELDQLMLRWLDARWAASDERERALFLRLLDSEDDKLWAWFMGRETPPDAALVDFVASVRDLPH